MHLIVSNDNMFNALACLKKCHTLTYSLNLNDQLSFLLL